MGKDIFDNFEITQNDELERFEFHSKTNDFASYLVAFNEADNLDDAKIAVYLAIQKERNEPIKKSLYIITKNNN